MSTAAVAALRIVSGAQTGVDRAALDRALAHGLDCGGWCPEGRQAEDGVIAARYPVTELAGSGYLERTLKNVEDADGTVIIYFGRPTGGTEKTLLFCLQRAKPYLLIDALELTPRRAAERIDDFLPDLPGTTLNFAGPRASGEPRAYRYTAATVDALVEQRRTRAPAGGRRS